MTVRRATDKERLKYGKAWMGMRRSKPIIPSTPPPAPWSRDAVAAYDKAAIGRDLPDVIASNLREINSGRLRGLVDLYFPYPDFHLLNCRWFDDGRRERVVPPNQFQIRKYDGVKAYQDLEKIHVEIVVWGQRHRWRFEDAALAALHAYRARTQAAEDDQEKLVHGEPVSPQQPRMNGHREALPPRLNRNPERDDQAIRMLTDDPEMTPEDIAISCDLKVARVRQLKAALRAPPIIWAGADPDDVPF